MIFTLGQDFSVDLTKLFEAKYAFTTNQLLQVATGLKELHEKRLAHGNVKSSRFIMENEVIKLHVKQTLMEGLEGSEFSSEFHPFSLFTKQKKTFSSDVFCCGIVFYEMLTHNTSLIEHPQLGNRTIAELCDIAEEWLHNKIAFDLKKCSHTNKILQGLILQMLSTDPNKRPKISQVCSVLECLNSFIIEDIPVTTDNKDRFVLIERNIGRGKALVHKAKDTKRGHDVALKTYGEHSIPFPELERLLEAFEKASTFNHPNVVQYLDHGFLKQEYENLHFVVMELASTDLHKYIISQNENKSRNNRSFFKENLLIFRNILKGYHYLRFSHNIIHRDLKPQNILMYRIAGEVVPKISDHDECKIASLDCVRTTLGDGTREYAAPELFDKDLSNNDLYEMVDIYSLGCILFFTLIKSDPLVDGITFFDRMIMNEEWKVHDFITQKIEELYHNTDANVKEILKLVLFGSIKKSPNRIPFSNFYAAIRKVLALMGHKETIDEYEEVISDENLINILKMHASN